MNRHNLDYIDHLFEQYKADPASVHADWKLFFDGVELASELDKSSFSKKEIKVYELINTYREDGHLKARLDPLQQKELKPFELAYFDLNKEDLEKKFKIFSLLSRPFHSLKELRDFLEKTYCSSLALHVGGCSPEIRHWFYREFEQGVWNPSPDQKKNILLQLTHAEAFEKFIHNRFIGAKRFSIEGSDALIPMLHHFEEKAPLLGIEEATIGMAHRGRLNVLTHFMNQPPEIILSQFEGKAFSGIGFTGDVKYHIGYSCDKKNSSGKNIKILMGFNSSHLESVNPIMMGVSRARQSQSSYLKVLPLIIHGDGAFCGQGVVSETLQLSRLKGYTVGGTLHIIINNQIGFTTEPEDGRSSPYASDLAQSIQAPILLVNGDDAEASVRAMDIAMRFRQEFKQDIIIDLISYRRFGHNEGDEPSFTQPLMYDTIKKHPTLMTLYKKQLLKEGVIKDEGEEFKKYTGKLQTILDNVKKKTPPITEKQLRGPYWPVAKRTSLEDIEEPCETFAKEKDFKKVLQALTTFPQNFHLHPKIKRLIEHRKKLLNANQLDWALAELCAYGVLCLEGNAVRLSGQDSIRGTFSHRHSSYFDFKDGKMFTPLAHLDPKQAKFLVCNAPLSEQAVLGFEYGNSCVDHSSLTLWEAQFGDFSNGAQIIIDQYLSSGEEKWLQSCALTLLLPHGYEGQGPEHSSARLERFLQLCAQNNLQVCCPTTPSNFFHVLRRQMKREFYKPLVLMTPKSLLRHPQVISAKKDFLEGAFQELIGDEPKDMDRVKTLILCTGKIYFEFLSKKPPNFDQVLLARMEQLYPFPKKALAPYINGFPNLKKIIWLQEEPRNMGAAEFIMPLIKELAKELGRENITIEYAGRKRQASPSAGSHQVHLEEQALLLKEALTLSRG